MRVGDCPCDGRGADSELEFLHALGTRIIRAAFSPYLRLLKLDTEGESESGLQGHRLVPENVVLSANHTSDQLWTRRKPLY